MKYFITDEALKSLSRIPKVFQIRILDKLDFIFKQTNPLSQAKKLNDFEYGDYRIRIGEYRGIFDIKNKTAYFLKFGHRKDIYK